MDHAFSVTSKKSLCYTRSQRFMHISSENFVIVALIFRSMAHF